MSCQLRSYGLRSTTGARSPSSRPPSRPAATPTIGSPPQGYTCGVATRSARDATISPRGSHAARHVMTRPARGARSRASRATAASPRHAHRALGRALRRSRLARAQHRTEARHRRGLPPVITPAVKGDEMRSYDCDYFIVAVRFGGCSAVQRTRLGSETGRITRAKRAGACS